MPKLTAGTHQCIVVAPFNGWFCESSKGTAGLRLPLEITSGECKGLDVEHIMYLSHAALPGTVKTLVEVFGWDRDIAALGNLVDSGPFVGKECEITVEMDEYNGKTFPKIKWLNKIGASNAKAMQKSAVSALVAKLAAEVMSVQLEFDPPKPKEKLSDPLGLTPDDIPF